MTTTDAPDLREAVSYRRELIEIAGMLAQLSDGPLRWKQYRLTAVADYLGSLAALSRNEEAGEAIPARYPECPYNHPVGTRCPACTDWPYPKGGAASYRPEAATPSPAQQSGELREAVISVLRRMQDHAQASRTGSPLGQLADEILSLASTTPPQSREWPDDAEFQFGQRVTTPRKPFWEGVVCGWYRNAEGRLGFNVEATAIPGAIHNYPQSGLRLASTEAPEDDGPKR